jgi:hypothetical protein
MQLDVEQGPARANTHSHEILPRTHVLSCMNAFDVMRIDTYVRAVGG